MRRPHLLILAALLALAAWVTPAGAARIKAPSSRQCVPPRVPVVAADPQAVLYLAPENREYPEFLSVYGCSHKTGRSYSLGAVPPSVGTPSGGGGVRLATLDGTMAAYAAGSGGPAGASWLVVVRDLSSGKVVHRVPSGTPAHPEPPRTSNGLPVGYVGIGPVESLVLKDDGALAWIAQDDFVGHASYQVHALDKTGGRVLAEGPEVEPHSLALAGSTLYWTQDGKPMSTTLN
jgi:hypothetical protein